MLDLLVKRSNVYLNFILWGVNHELSNVIGTVHVDESTWNCMENVALHSMHECATRLWIEMQRDNDDQENRIPAKYQEIKTCQLHCQHDTGTRN